MVYKWPNLVLSSCPTYFKLSDLKHMDAVFSTMCHLNTKDNSSTPLFLPAETLDEWQRKAILTNPGLDLEVPVEIGVILLSHFADEMLLRAVLLQGEPPLGFISLLALAGHINVRQSQLVPSTAFMLAVHSCHSLPAPFLVMNMRMLAY